MRTAVICPSLNLQTRIYLHHCTCRQPAGESSYNKLASGRGSQGGKSTAGAGINPVRRCCGMHRGGSRDRRGIGRGKENRERWRGAGRKGGEQGWKKRCSTELLQAPPAQPRGLPRAVGHPSPAASGTRRLRQRPPRPAPAAVAAPGRSRSRGQHRAGTRQRDPAAPHGPPSLLPPVPPRARPLTPCTWKPSAPPPGRSELEPSPMAAAPPGPERSRPQAAAAPRGALTPLPQARAAERRAQCSDTAERCGRSARFRRLARGWRGTPPSDGGGAGEARRRCGGGERGGDNA